MMATSGFCAVTCHPSGEVTPGSCPESLLLLYAQSGWGCPTLKGCLMCHDQRHRCCVGLRQSAPPLLPSQLRFARQWWRHPRSLAAWQAEVHEVHEAQVMAPRLWDSAALERSVVVLHHRSSGLRLVNFPAHMLPKLQPWDCRLLPCPCLPLVWTR
mmetsp:Transcript_75595/g.175278  ORF Transcript_75595/g.175278 Transcript_75595/m.175278 type:complete len:156 (+) Transcript_75595:101-568(+)